MGKYVCPFEDLRAKDVAIAGGKNASLGEMIAELKPEGVNIPGGFAVTAEAYRYFIRENGLEKKIETLLKTYSPEPKKLRKCGKAIRKLIEGGKFPSDLKEEITDAYHGLCGENTKRCQMDVAVRSSATAEDLPDASFAGQQETFLNIRGDRDLLNACRKCFASLFTDRAIAYREEKGFNHREIALSVGIQKMVRSDLASSGVMFTLDTETGFDQVIEINSTWGLGENIVQGVIIPDEFTVYKPFLDREGVVPIVGKVLGSKEKKMVYARGESYSTKNIMTTPEEQKLFSITDEEVLQLAKWAVLIEKHYQKPMDIEWAKDGGTGELYIVQARPETVQVKRKKSEFKTYKLKKEGKKILEGLAIGESIAVGHPQVITDADQIEAFQPGSILVTGMTDPDWVPIMKMASGIITDQGGRTSHAAIVSRELGVPAIVGTGTATEELKDFDEVTLSCAQGDKGFIYEGALEYEEEEIHIEKLPKTKTQVMLNIASPSAAFHWWRLPCRGIGLARMEFIISEMIKIHPMALTHFEEVEDLNDQMHISEMTLGFESKTEYFIGLLALGIAKIACTRYPDPVIVRMSDFKTNEYANLIGGKQFEPKEENPMLGFRGAVRYYHPKYREGFALECRAIKRAREKIGLSNIIVMIPFCRTIQEAEAVLKVMEEEGLKRGENGLEVYVMAEVPSNILLAADFAKLFDGFSIGSNDLTQLTLGVDRDSADLAPLFDERNPAVKKLIQDLIIVAHQHQCKVGICGQGPSDYPDFAEFLVECGIDSISLNPDSVIHTIERIAAIEQKRG
ncbi:MAG: phosphoenolpyruvate synthase [Simkania sp.]|nr:phosphoenolpyruvate synthase [Simkania sp.]MCP5490168.1 phosphoenolpyruvate synthase [Chlamydiales bacterium]